MSFSLVRVASRFSTHHVKWLAKKKKETYFNSLWRFGFGGALQGCKFMGGLPRSEIAMRLPTQFSRCTHKYRTKNIFN